MGRHGRRSSSDIRHSRIRRAVLVTDGYVGRPGATDRQTLRQTRLGVALVSASSTLGDLEGLYNHSVTLTEIAE